MSEPMPPYSSIKLDTSTTATPKLGMSAPSAENGTPMLPKARALTPAARKMCSIRDTVVVLPLVPLTAIFRAGQTAAASCNSENTETPLFRSAVSKG